MDFEHVLTYLQARRDEMPNGADTPDDYLTCVSAGPSEIVPPVTKEELLQFIDTTPDVAGMDRWLKAPVQSADPRLLCGWLRRMGYSEICDEIGGFWGTRHVEHIEAISVGRMIRRFAAEGVTQRPQTRTSLEAEDLFHNRKQLDLLKKAQQKLDSGHMVLLAINTDILDAMKGRPVRPASSEDQHLHYAVARRLQVTPLTITAEIRSYGNVTTGAVNTTIFLQRFYGFISAKP